MSTFIYCTRKIPEVGLQLLYDKGYIVETGTSDVPPTKESIIHDLQQKDYKAVISFLTDTIDEDVMKACPTVKLFANYAVGYNNIDLPKAAGLGITVTNTRGSSSRAVAETTVALILAVTTRLVEGHQFIHEGKYKGFDPDLLIGTDISDKTVGLIGVGDIGNEVARMLHHGFNCPIIYSDVKNNDQAEQAVQAKKVEIDELCRTADIISLHVPLLPSTTHLINEERLKMMKPGAILINTARGPVVDEKALINALYHGTLTGAGLDVYEFEPIISEKLLMFKNVILTPHIASARKSVRENMAVIAANNVISFLETGQALTPVHS